MQLCHVGAPSQSIAPVTYMWRSICQESRCGDGMNHNSDGDNRSESRGCCSSSRQIWMWIHVSAVIEGLDALKLACQKEVHILNFVIRFHICNIYLESKRTETLG